MTAPACPLTAAELRVMANWRKGVARDSSAALAKLNEARRPTGKAITDILALWLAASMEREAELLAALSELTLRCDGHEGIRADESNIQTYSAHAAIARAEAAKAEEGKVKP